MSLFLDSSGRSLWNTYSQLNRVWHLGQQPLTPHSTPRLLWLSGFGHLASLWVLNINILKKSFEYVMQSGVPLSAFIQPANPLLILVCGMRGGMCPTVFSSQACCRDLASCPIIAIFTTSIYLSI